MGLRRWLPPLFITASLLALVWIAQRVVEPELEHRRRQQLLQRIELTLPLPYDNDPLTDRLDVEDDVIFSVPQKFSVYRLRLHGVPQGAVLMPLVAAGYNDPIVLAVGIAADGRIAGVRILSQNETRGLGDGIGAETWLAAFAGRSLGDPPVSQWTVRADGGVFDQFSGATVSPRAVVHLLRDGLRYHAATSDRLYR